MLICSYLSEPDPLTGLYPVQLAAKNANLTAIKKLLSKSNVNFDVVDQEGNTVHHFAAESNKEIVSVSSNYMLYLNDCSILKFRIQKVD